VDTRSYSKTRVPSSLDAPLPPTRALSVLGSTGSIGSQTLTVARQEGFEVKALAAGRRMDRLADQVALFRPAYVSVLDEAAKRDLIQRLREAYGLDQLPQIGVGRQGAVLAARWPEADTVVAAITGFAGLEPVLAAADAGRKIALANKESLVVAGQEVRKRAEESGAWILPVDSEHSAIWQCRLAAPPDSIRRLILTCSGGPFVDHSSEELRQVTLAEALSHPTWSMGGKITIDSATLMNKAFEVIEACHLFDLSADRVDVAVHRQSLVHSLVEFTDGALLAQLGDPDMALPIRFALTFPRRSDRPQDKPFDLLAEGRSAWTFEPVRREIFPSIDWGREVYAQGGLMPLVLNAANEAALARFMAGEIAFLSIFSLIRQALDEFSHLSAMKASSFDDMMSAHVRVMDYVAALDAV